MVKKFPLFSIIIIAAFIASPTYAYAHKMKSSTIAKQMAQSAQLFLNALSPKQREQASFDFEDSERFNWHYVPRNRKGLALKEMNEEQQALALKFLKVGLSAKGYWKSTTIMKLEAILREIESWNWLGRDPQKYFFTIFGHPEKEVDWGWRVEGHHLSFNVTIIRGHLFSMSPRFLGANPAQIPLGDLTGIRAMGEEEDLARTLMQSMDRKQLQKTIFSERAYGDIVTGSEAEVRPLNPVGIIFQDLTAEQKNLLVRLIDEYLSVLPDEIAQQRLTDIRRDELANIYFGWAGSLNPGQPHYYRIQGTYFLIEYDNVQNGANHIHTVWRDFDGDFGRDILREHYQAAHR